MTDCEAVSDQLADYLNRRLSPRENGEIAAHLAVCPRCREEAAVFFRLRSAVQSRVADVPASVARSAFDRLPPETCAPEDLTPLNSCLAALNSLRDAFSTVRQPLCLAKKIIEGGKNYAQ